MTAVMQNPIDLPVQMKFIVSILADTFLAMYGCVGPNTPRARPRPVCPDQAKGKKSRNHFLWDKRKLFSSISMIVSNWVKTVFNVEDLFGSSNNLGYTFYMCAIE